MAKRKKLEAPSAEDLSKFEDEFRRETSTRAAAPIAQVAAETAAAFEVGDAGARADRARDQSDAADLRKADADGRLIREIAIHEIEALSMRRDRTVIDETAQAELEHSISSHGIRLPIEVYELPAPHNGRRYGLLSGYRRLLAQQNLFARTQMDKFLTIRALLRNPDEMGGAFVAMVEENEIRQDLSHYERGRIAAIAAQQGAFHNTEEAVNKMFAAASKAKRSKIRSFSMIFEELGDLLQFPENMREKDGLRLAQALRAGAEARLREVLDTGQGVDALSEWALLEAGLKELGDAGKDPARGGRPRVSVPKAGWAGNDTLHTSTGVTMRRESDSNGYLIRFTGKGLSTELMEMIMRDIQEKLEMK